MTERNYDSPECWQYTIRANTLTDDLKKLGLNESGISKLRCSDFAIDIVHTDNKKVFNEVKAFIERYEWLGTMSLYPTHIFTARFHGILGGVVIMDMPITFSKMLGEDTRKIERLISRGACASWTPKNLASTMISLGMKWISKNTRFRLFVAYSDTEAKELGTIYQACNFYYLGNTFGAGYQYKLDSGKWVSDRYFRSRSVYKRIALSEGIIWNPEWQQKDRILFAKMPTDIAAQIKNASKQMQNSCEKRSMTPKHKYAYVLGKNKAETKVLRKLFLDRNKVYPYPKERGK